MSHNTAENPGDTATTSETELRDALCDVCSWSFCGSAEAEQQGMGTRSSTGRIVWQSILSQLFSRYAEHFDVQCAIKPGAHYCCHSHGAIESLDHLQCSRKWYSDLNISVKTQVHLEILIVSLVNQCHLYGSQAAMALMVFHMRCCWKLMNTHILSGHHSISTWTWWDFSSLQ